MNDSAYPCPGCGTPATLASGCPGCGRGPDPDAAEVHRLNLAIPVLTERYEQARRTYLTAGAELTRAREQREYLAARVRIARSHRAPTAPARTPAPVAAPVAVGVPAGAAGAPPVARPAGPAPSGPAVPRPETSSRTVQNLLYVLGGLLLGTAAVVFTAVAWASVGVAGRATILAAVTVLVLAVPLVAVRRALTGTAETFAAVGLLLVLLDGYAARTVDLFGVADWSGSRYAAVAVGAAALVSAGYRRLTGLATPWFAALALGQPVLPLLAADARPEATGWSLTFAGLAALDLTLVALLTRGRPATVARRVAAWVAYAVALALAAATGLVALAIARPAGTVLLAGVPLLVAALLLVAGAVVARDDVFRAIAGAVLVVVLAMAAVRPGEPRQVPLAVRVAVAAVLLAVAVRAVGRLLPARVHLGPRIGALLVAGAVALWSGLTALAVGGVTVNRALAARSGDPLGELPSDWSAPVAVLLAAGALALLVPPAARRMVALVGGGVTVLAAPAAYAHPVPVILIGDLVPAVVLLVGAVRLPSVRPVDRVVAAVVGAVLTGHAVGVGLAGPGATAAVLAVVTLVGVAVALLAPLPGSTSAARVGVPAVVVGAVAAAVGLVVLPAAVGFGLSALGATDRWSARGALAATALLVGALGAVQRWRRGQEAYAAGAFAAAVAVVGLVPVLGRIAEPRGVYPAVGVLLVALALLLVARPRPDRTDAVGRAGAGAAVPQAGASPGSRTLPAWSPPGRDALPAWSPPGRDALPAWSPPMLAAGAVLLLAAAASVLGALLAVLVSPYRWWGGIWSGAPDGVGLVPTGIPVPAAVGQLDAAAVTVLLLLAAAAVLVGRALGRTGSAVRAVAAPLAATAVPVALAAAGARWPTVPVVMLLGGLAGLLVATFAGRHGAAPRRRRTGPVPAVVAVALTGAGLSGLLATPAGTLAGLGALVAVTAAIGAAGRSVTVRLAGWLTGAVALAALALFAALAADLPLRQAAFGVLAASALLVGVGAALRRSRPVESLAVEAAGQAGALVALLLTLGAIRYAAAVGTLWGVVAGLRALVPGEPVRRRWGWAVVAAVSELLATWLLLAGERVALPEAYTLPAAALALVAGLLATRARPALTSWLAYGPGLAAALLPSLVSVLVAGGQPWRRLLLGTAALVVVLLGATRRRQAPVVIGAGTLAVVALRELVDRWDLLPRWVYLGAGGLILIGLAMTYERRLRDLSRLRSAVGRMS